MITKDFLASVNDKCGTLSPQKSFQLNQRVKNQTFYTQAKKPTGPDSLLRWLEALLAMPFMPAPPSGFGVVSNSDSQVTVPCPPGNAARGPILLLPDSPWI